MLVVMVGWVLLLLGVSAAFHPLLQGSPWTWLAFGACQLPIAVAALWKMHKDEELWERLRPQWGDISVGIGSAVVLLAFAWFAGTLAAPIDSTRHEWLTRAYAQAGSSQAIEKHWVLVLVAVVLVTVLDEIAWRGHILRVFEERLGTRKAWPVAGLLYAVAFVPSIYFLRTEAGLNPIVWIVVLPAGMVWSFLAARTQRLVPSALSHAVFLWFAVVQFRFLAHG